MQVDKSFILHGDICFTKNHDKFNIYNDANLICIDGKCAGVFNTIPDKYLDLTKIDHSGKLIIPGFVDLHTHASQFKNMGIGMDKPLLDWLDDYTFPEEIRFKDFQYARSIYEEFVKNLKNSSTTRAVIFATIHSDSTALLMELLNSAGLGAYVGKLTMNRDAPKELLEKTDNVYENLEKFVLNTYNKYELVKPIVTPRFIPSCTDSALKDCAKIAEKYNIPVQSHLDENPDEIKYVSKLCPNSKNYTDAYVQQGLISKSIKTVMAHCIYLKPEEIEVIKQNEVFIAHCPQSNINISSGIAPVVKYLSMGLNVGLATDISGGANLEMERVIVDTINVSKALSLYDKSIKRPLLLSEAFYVATKGGGKFFGNVGSFEEGYDFDAIVIEDEKISQITSLNTVQRLERALYNYSSCKIVDKYVAGNKILLN